MSFFLSCLKLKFLKQAYQFDFFSLFSCSFPVWAWSHFSSGLNFRFLEGILRHSLECFYVRGGLLLCVSNSCFAVSNCGSCICTFQTVMEEKDNDWNSSCFCTSYRSSNSYVGVGSGYWDVCQVQSSSNFRSVFPSGFAWHPMNVFPFRFSFTYFHNI